MNERTRDQTVLVISGRRKISERVWFCENCTQALSMQAWLDFNGIACTVMTRETYNNGGSYVAKRAYRKSKSAPTPSVDLFSYQEYELNELDSDD